MPPKQEMVIPHLPLCSLGYSGGTLMVTAAPKLEIQMKDECISPFRNPLIQRFYNNVVSIYLMSIFMYFYSLLLSGYDHSIVLFIISLPHFYLLIVIILIIA